MKISTFGVLLLLFYASYVNALRPEQVAVVVLSQADSYHSSLALELKHDLLQQYSSLGENKPKIFLTHKDFPHVGAWVVSPISSHIVRAVGPDTLWFIFCEERTRFNLRNLLSVLSHHDPSKEVWLGHGLSDKEPTIVHHFQIFPKAMQYPLLASGFAVSAGLMKRINISPKVRKSIFSIDAMYELALRVNHTSLLSLPSVFCLENNYTECATYPLPFIPCGEPVPNEDIYFAVKTCLKFHKQRVPVVQNTWGKDASNIEFFSDVEDKSIPTTSVGIANLAVGHCAKTKEILKLALKRVMQSQNLQWVVLTDDDTLLSVPRLRDLLSCWADQPVVIGERYGFEVYLSSGYNYLTGGAGIAISSTVLPKLVNELHCYSDTAPDDMVMGSVLTQLGINIVHSPLFHQARPMDYPAGYLATQEPISFHKYWEVDPFSVYERWFASHPQTSPEIHTEL